MLGLAGDGTSVAADTFSVIDYEAEIHRRAKPKCNVKQPHGLVMGYFPAKPYCQMVRNHFDQSSVNKLSPKCALCCPMPGPVRKFKGGTCP